MSLLTDIRHDLKKYVEDDRLLSVLSFLTYHNIQSHNGNENLSERISVVEEGDADMLIFDEEFGEYFLIKQHGKKIFRHHQEHLLAEHVE